MTETMTARAIARFLDNGDPASVAVALRQQHPADIAAVIAAEPPARIGEILRTLPDELRGQVFGYLEPREQLALAEALETAEMARILETMSHDERADFAARLDDEDRAVILPALAQAERDDLLHLASYPEGTVGALMTSDYATVPAELTAAQAIEHLRRAAPNTETIYICYILDADGRLIGRARLRDLIVARPDARVSEIMQVDPPRLKADAPRSEAVAMIRRYDVLALPVVDAEGRLVGIVTHDDVADAAAAEAERQIHGVGAVAGVVTPVRDAAIAHLYRRRISWLILLVFANIFSGAGIAYFEETIEAHIALVFFLPLLIDSGGNAGSQSATLMVRALATGDVRQSDWARLLGRETAVAAGLGLTMALAVSGLGLLRGGPDIALVVSVTMVLIVLMGSLIGMSLPFVLNRLGFDPATASAPLVTSIADATGVLIYFGMATWILGVAAAG